MQSLHLFEELSREKSNFGKIIVVAIFVGLGVGIIANSSVILMNNPLSGLIIGITIVAMSSFFLIALIFSNQTKIQNTKGLLIYDEKENKIIPIPRYSVSENLKDYLKAAFKENSELKNLWESHKLNE